jgi:hypothetical protein
MNLQRGQIWYYTETKMTILVVGADHENRWTWMHVNIHSNNWNNPIIGWASASSSALLGDLQMSNAKLIGHINELDIESFVQEKLTVDISAS